MPEQSPKYRDLEPTVVPAQAGFRLAMFGYGTDNKPNDQTKPTELWATYTTIIAWIIGPRVKTGPDYTEVDHAAVHPVTPDGMHEERDYYVVDPTGAWSQPYVADFDGELSARKHWLETRLPRR